jgi:hypothetical protein
MLKIRGSKIDKKKLEKTISTDGKRLYRTTGILTAYQDNLTNRKEKISDVKPAAGWSRYNTSEFAPNGTASCGRWEVVGGNIEISFCCKPRTHPRYDQHAAPPARLRLSALPPCG